MLAVATTTAYGEDAAQRRFPWGFDALTYDTPYRAHSIAMRRALLLLITASAVTSGTCSSPVSSSELGRSPAALPATTATHSINDEGSRNTNCKPSADSSSAELGAKDHRDEIRSSRNQIDSVLSEIIQNDIRKVDADDIRLELNPSVCGDQLGATETANTNEIKHKITILSIPITRDTFALLTTTLGLSCFGLLHVMKLCVQVRKRCRCKLCRADYVLLEPVSTYYFTSQRRRRFLRIDLCVPLRSSH